MINVEISSTFSSFLYIFLMNNFLGHYAKKFSRDCHFFILDPCIS